jgi:hypothetical protein
LTALVYRINQSVQKKSKGLERNIFKKIRNQNQNQYDLAPRVHTIKNKA